MMRKLFVIIIVTAMLISACSQRLTRQFILPKLENGGNAPEKNLQGWLIEHPGVSAYKNVINLEKIKNPNEYWITIRGKHKQSKDEPVRSDIVIDSVMVSFFTEDDNFVRYPTRSSGFNSRTANYKIKAFDFFEDQGLIIPLAVDSILLSFNILLYDDGQAVDSGYYEYRLFREEKSQKVPFLQQ